MVWVWRSNCTSVVRSDCRPSLPLCWSILCMLDFTENFTSQHSDFSVQLSHACFTSFLSSSQSFQCFWCWFAMYREKHPRHGLMTSSELVSVVTWHVAVSNYVPRFHEAQFSVVSGCSALLCSHWCYVLNLTLLLLKELPRKSVFTGNVFIFLC